MDYERTPWAKRRSEQRKRDAALRYYLEIESRKLGWQDPALVYGEEKDLFRFTDGRFAFFYLIAYAAIVSLVRESLFPKFGE